MDQSPFTDSVLFKETLLDKIFALLLMSCEETQGRTTIGQHLSWDGHMTTPFSRGFPGAGAGDVGVVIVDSNGRRDTVEIVLENKGDSIFRCTYGPVLEGPHVVYVSFAGQQIPRSPFTVHISEGRAAHGPRRPPPCSVFGLSSFGISWFIMPLL